MRRATRACGSAPGDDDKPPLAKDPPSVAEALGVRLASLALTFALTFALFLLFDLVLPRP